MKHTISFSLREETIQKIREKLRESNTFRSKSHLVDYALEKYLEEENGKH